jgi:mRNA interferase MazF
VGTFKKGSVVLIRFPFSDLSSQKLRPAVVLAGAGKGDYILCQVTSKPYDNEAFEIADSSFSRGTLHRQSFARPGKLFTANESILLKEVACLSDEAVGRLVDRVIAILQR